MISFFLLSLPIFAVIGVGWAAEAGGLRGRHRPENHVCYVWYVRDHEGRANRWNRRCPVITWAVAPPAVSQVHSFGSSLRASLSRLPQIIAETRVPTVRRPSPRRRVAQLGPTLRIGAGQTMGDAILSRDR